VSLLLLLSGVGDGTPAPELEPTPVIIPTRRLYNVPFEDRSLSVPYQDRSLSAPFEDRVFEVKPE
jgi:hypothetical protein